jgi:hypothetical protein
MTFFFFSGSIVISILLEPSEPILFGCIAKSPIRAFAGYDGRLNKS